MNNEKFLQVFFALDAFCVLAYFVGFMVSSLGWLLYVSAALLFVVGVFGFVHGVTHREGKLPPYAVISLAGVSGGILLLIVSFLLNK